MAKNEWWWVVYDQKGGLIDGSDNYQQAYVSGKTARNAAEQAASNYINMQSLMHNGNEVKQ